MRVNLSAATRRRRKWHGIHRFLSSPSAGLFEEKKTATSIVRACAQRAMNLGAISLRLSNKLTPNNNNLWSLVVVSRARGRDRASRVVLPVCCCCCAVQLLYSSRAAPRAAARERRRERESARRRCQEEMEPDLFAPRAYHAAGYRMQLFFLGAAFCPSPCTTY